MNRPVLMSLGLLIAAGAAAGPGETTCVTLSSTGAALSGSSFNAAVSADGRFVVFDTSAKLVPEDSDTRTDVYIRNLETGELRIVSTMNSGAQVTTASYQAQDVSGDGRYVLLLGDDDIIPGSDNDVRDLFVHDMLTGSNTRVSVSSTGDQGNNYARFGVISNNGRYVAFESQATNLSATDLNQVMDIYLHDLETGQTSCVSVNPAGFAGKHSSSQPVTVTDDGRFTCFISNATDLVTGDTNGREDIFVFDRIAGASIRANLSNTGMQMRSSYLQDHSMSANGRYVVFSTGEAEFVEGDANCFQTDVFVRDLQLNTTTLVSKNTLGQQGTSSSLGASISDDGRYIAFRSLVSTFVHGDANGEVDGFILDRMAGTLRLISRSTGNIQANRTTDEVIVSGDGRVIVFTTTSTTLGVPSGGRRIYAHEQEPANSIASLTLSKPTVAGQNTVVGTLMMEHPTAFGGEYIQVTANHPSVFVASPVLVPLLADLKSFAIKSFPVNSPTVVVLTAVFGTQTRTASISVVPLVPSAFQFTPAVVDGGTTVSARLVINGVAPPLGLNVNLSDNSAFATVPGSVMVPSGGTQVIFDIATAPSATTHYVTVTATTPGGSKTGTFKINGTP